MRSRGIQAILGLFSLILLCPLFVPASHAQSENIIVVPRHPGNLPSVELKSPDIPDRTKRSTLPDDRGAVASDTLSTSDTVNVGSLKPQLMSTIGLSGKMTDQINTEERRQLSPEGYFFVNGKVEGVGWAKLYLYDHRGGFFDLYDNDQEMNLLGTAYMDSNGRFRIGPIKYKNQWYYRGKDVILVMELESPYAVAYSDIYGTVQPFRYKISERKRVTPEGGSFSMGTINIDLEKDQYYPVRAFDRIVRRLQSEGSGSDQKVRIEFVRDVDKPRYMEEIGYILMPYSGEAEE